MYARALGFAARMGGVLALLLVMMLTVPPLAARADKGTDFYNQGLAAQKQGNYAQAVHDFEQALLNSHNDPKTFYQLGVAFRQNKQLNYAAWAFAAASSDPVFQALNPTATTDLAAVQKAGGLDQGPPPTLTNVTVKPMPAPKLSAAKLASRQSAAAFTSLQTGAFFVSPGYAHAMTFDRQGELSQAAQDAQEHSNTVAKTVFLDGTPAPYASLQTYAEEFLTHLNIPRSVVVVVTPQGVAAASDRLDDNAARSIGVATLHRLGTGDPAALAAGITRAIVQQADSNDDASARRSLAIAIGIGAAVFVVLAIAIVRVARGAPSSPTVGRRSRGRLAARSR